MLFLFLGLITVLVILLLVRPWSRGSSDTGNDQDRLRISIYQQNLRELDREFERGQLTREQLDNVRNELELSLLAELERDKKPETAGTPAPRGLAALVLPVCVFILLAVPLYVLLGNPQMYQLETFNRMAKELPEDQQLPLEQIIPELEKHLQRNPDDGNAWLLLANMYSTTEQPVQAVNAYAALYRLAGDDPDVMMRYANALIVANNGKFGGKPAELAHKVLAIEPANYTALLFAGMAADEAGEYAEALQYYRRLLPGLQGNAQMEQTVNSLIARNEQLLRDAGIDPGVTETPASPVANPVAVLKVAVSIAEEMNGKFAPEDTVFIYAQALNGPPMPLAVARHKASELPLEVALDDSMAMMPAMKLSAFSEVRVQARISKSGNAQPEPGDLIGVQEPVRLPSGESVQIIIDKVMP